MATSSVTKLAERAQSATQALRNYKQKARINERRMLSKGEVVVGGVVGGLVDGKWGEGGEPAELLGLPGVALAGAGLTILGISDLVPAAEDIASVGAGMLSYSLGAYTRAKVEEAE